MMNDNEVEVVESASALAKRGKLPVAVKRSATVELNERKNKKIIKNNH